MPPKRIIDFLFGRLMAAYHASDFYKADTLALATVVFYSSNYTQYALDGTWQGGSKALATKCSAWLDQYPFREFEQFLKTAVGDAKQASLNDAETSAVFRTKMEEFFKRIADAPEWEVLRGVFGFSASQRPFNLGPCRFFIMDHAELYRWGQRRASGRFDPPPDITPRAFALPGAQTGLDEQLLDNWVASLRVRAIDANHAIAKSMYRLEEVLNVLRHGAFLSSIPQHCVRAGLGNPQFWNDLCACVRIDQPGGFQDSAGHGAEGLTISTCGQLCHAWEPLHKVLSKEGTDRTSLETSVMTALEWVGQAAAAPLRSVRVVSLMTALEVLVLDESDTSGKRSKLSRRVARIAQRLRPGTQGIQETADRLYQVRSECLHEGATQVEDDDIRLAYNHVDAVITAFLTTDPFCGCESVRAVLAAIRDPDEAPNKARSVPIEAHYQDGVFKPVTPLNLPNDARVLLSVQLPTA